LSYFFEVSGETVWDPALRIAKWYIALAESTAGLMQLPTGLTPSEQDTCDIDPKVFRGFVEGLYEVYFSTRHPVQHGLIKGLLLTSMVVLERTGAVISPGSEREQALWEEKQALARSM
jgi:hypothetical protein